MQISNIYTTKKAIDLFCGCGGLTLGLRRAKFDVLVGLDLNSNALEVYKANHPRVKAINADIRTVATETLMEITGISKGELDLLAGCPPCQGFSTIRTRNGHNSNTDPRNDLLLEFLRIARGLMPKSIMLENVPGLRSDSNFLLFKHELEQLGYIGKDSVLDVAEYNVPQKRRRLIYLAGKGFSISFAPKSSKKSTVRKAISKLPPVGTSGDYLHDTLPNHTERVKEIIKNIPVNGGSRNALPFEYQLDCHKNIVGFRDVYGRMKWDAPAPTITSGCTNPSKGRFLHPEENRAITLREAAILQGFPVKYKFGSIQSRSAIALMVGNALPPNFIKVHAAQIYNSLDFIIAEGTSNG